METCLSNSTRASEKPLQFLLMEMVFSFLERKYISNLAILEEVYSLTFIISE